MKEKFIPTFVFQFLTKLFDSFIAFTIPEKRIKEELIDLMNIRKKTKYWILDAEQVPCSCQCLKYVDQKNGRHMTKLNYIL
jgi:hypothetical protein